MGNLVGLRRHQVRFYSDEALIEAVEAREPVEYAVANLTARPHSVTITSAELVDDCGRVLSTWRGDVFVSPWTDFYVQFSLHPITYVH